MVFIIASKSVLISLSAVHLYDFHIFTAIYSSIHGFIWKQHNDRLLIGLLAQLVERCTGIVEVMGSNPVQGYSVSCLIFTTHHKGKLKFVKATTLNELTRPRKRGCNPK